MEGFDQVAVWRRGHSERNLDHDGHNQRPRFSMSGVASIGSETPQTSRASHAARLPPQVVCIIM